MKNLEVPVRYNDLAFRVILSLIAAHVIVTLGEDETFFQLLVMWDYYRSLLLSFLIAFVLVNAVYLVTINLDRRLDWKEQPLLRTGLQLLFALFIPAVVAFLLAVIYFQAYGYPITHTWYLRYDYPMIILMLVVLNIYYLAFYFFRRWQMAERNSAQAENVMAIAVQDNKEKGQEVFVVSKGAKQIPLEVSSIAYFFHEGDYNFLRTFDKEDFMISETLDEVQHRISAKEFFRVSRQIIVNFRACNHFSPMEYGRLKLSLKPDIKETVIVSQRRAKVFREWVMR